MYDISTRAYIVALKATSRLSSREIFSLTGVPTRTIDRIYAKAIERGFEPNASQLTIKDSYFEDAARSGRPPVASPEAAKAILSKPRRSRYLSRNRLEGSSQVWIAKDEADEEAWVDEEDEEGTA
ncbi:unnamed protein product [Clonostachys rosea f. rosea IK726]|uniref:Uncharacterized protein n=2 Tax=Bionectria ochroleuca TaxID=29856 RepID=A0A0B7JY59_BIOOC|nr:unnamed protein product [Clonostachys rosea f. rosea IK726]